MELEVRKKSNVTIYLVTADGLQNQEGGWVGREEKDYYSHEVAVHICDFKNYL